MLIWLFSLVFLVTIESLSKSDKTL